MENKSYPELHQLINVVTKLRDPNGGCPWDLEQTHQTLLPFLLEESYEFIEAVEKNSHEHMKEEIGDVLLQVLLHSVIAQQEGYFTLEDVAKNLTDKLISRHPHVFGENANKNQANLSSEKVIENWINIKKEEKAGIKEYFIGEKLLHHPALSSSHKIGKKTKEVNFDWQDYTQVIYKVEEEWQELKEELPPVFQKLTPNMLERVEEELGDMLFSMAQLARHLNLDAEEVLRKANKKFIHRFQKMEDIIEKQKQDKSKLSPQEWNHLWGESKIQTAQDKLR